MKGISLKCKFIIVAILMMCLCLFAISILTAYTMSRIITDKFYAIGKKAHFHSKNFEVFNYSFRGWILLQYYEWYVQFY